MLLLDIDMNEDCTQATLQWEALPAPDNGIGQALLLRVCVCVHVCMHACMCACMRVPDVRLVIFLFPCTQRILH